MNMEHLKGNWKQLKGKVRTQWGKLTDDDLEQIAGRKDELVGKLQVRYGHARDEAEREVDSWLSKL
ncbi:MAG: CsbD family protein [Polyangiaceae bacterium]